MRPAFLALLFAGYAMAQNGAPAPAPAPASSSSTTRPAAQPSQTTARPAASTPATNTPAAQSSPTQAAASSSETPKVYTGTPTFIFLPMATATQCAKAQVRWDLRNEDRSKFAVNLYAFNIGVDQSIPPQTETSTSSSSSSSAANSAASPNANSANTPNPSTSRAPTPAAATSNTPAANNRPATAAVAGGGAASAPAKRAPAEDSGPHIRLAARHGAMPYNLEHMHLVARADNVNSTVVKDWTANVAYSWLVDVPTGRYRFLAVVNDTHGTWSESDPFTVAAGSDTSCVKKDTSDATASASSTGGASPGSANETDGATESKKSGIGGGGIAGIVIGVIAALVLAAIAFFCLRKAKREKRRDAGGREPQTPMRNLISEPTDFRKTKSARGSVGHALAAIGLSRNSNSHAGSNMARVDRAERGEKPMFPAIPSGRRRGSNMTTDTNDNPFETAPTTPVEEKPPATPGSSFGTSIPPSSALAAGRDYGDNSTRNSHATHPSSGYPPMSPPTDAQRQSAYDAVALDDDADGYRRSTPTPMRLPAANLASSTAGGSIGQMTPGANNSAGPNTPVTPGFATASRGSHHSRPSQGSVADPAHAAATSTPNPPPSAFQTPSMPSSPGSAAPRAPERKTSMRRKPVPRLGPEEASMTTSQSTQDMASLSLGTSSDSGHGPQGPLRLPDAGRVGTGPAGDEYGLNAALAGIDRQNFTLMADPPLDPDADNRRY